MSNDEKVGVWFCGKWKKELVFIQYCLANACEHLYKRNDFGEKIK